MKYISLLAFTLLSALFVKAAPGDTTWIQAHNDMKLSYYGDYDTTIAFPDGTTQYRKIIMVFTLGKYNCGGGYDPANAGEPPKTGWCADWDYTVQNFLMNKKGDTLELGRLITPYANTTFPQFPWSWKQPYYFDVTDYYPALKDSALLRVHYSGYSGGFTANIRFAMVEGTPDRNVTGIKHLWSGSFDYGKSADPIDNHTSTVSLTPPAGTAGASFKFNITGHGNDAGGCSEFCQRYYRVFKDGSMVKQTNIWRDNCGANEIARQSGTWLYDRGNWCPGALVNTNIHPLPTVTAGTPFDLRLNFQSYSSAGGASYTIDGAVVYYGNFNKTLDAAIEKVSVYNSPSTPGFTSARIHNAAATPITSIAFEYGVTGKLTTYTWTGTLAPLADTIVSLPVTTPMAEATGTGIDYEVNILKVNSATDDDATNNKFKTTFDAIPEWVADSLIIQLNTNYGTSAGYSETEWKISDMASGAIVAQGIHNPVKKLSADTLRLPAGVYRLDVTDVACNGLNSWMYPGDGAGTFVVRPSRYKSFTLANYFAGDFGCGFTQYFRLVPATTAIDEANKPVEALMDVFPNPANDQVSIALHSSIPASGMLVITDNTGKAIVVQQINSQDAVKIATANFANGLYFVSFVSSDPAMPRLQTKLVIMK